MTIIEDYFFFEATNSKACASAADPVLGDGNLGYLGFLVVLLRFVYRTVPLLHLHVYVSASN